MQSIIKKGGLLSWLTAVALTLALWLLPGVALADAADSITVSFSLVKDGSFVIGSDSTRLAAAELSVTDRNADGSFSVDEAFRAAHETYCAAGAEGYAVSGTLITKLWGYTTGAVGYYVNDASAWSPADSIEDGDRLCAFFYQDTSGYSDAYTWFDAARLTVSAGKSFSLTLKNAGYDENWNLVEAPLAGATISVDGEATAHTTNASGQVTLSFAAAGTYLISATPVSGYIVPPLCLVTVVTQEAKVKGLLDGIAAKYAAKESWTAHADDWVMMCMGAYADYAPGSRHLLTAAQQQEYLSSAITVGATASKDTDIDKLILALSAIDIDPSLLSNGQLDLVAKLNAATHTTSVWAAPYTLAAYQQSNFANSEKEQALIDALLTTQKDGGQWTEWGESVQSTANAIIGLSFYYDEQAAVKTAVDKAVAWLSSQQENDGSFDAYGSGPDANTAATVVMALAAVGIDPAADAAFIKNNRSALDSLLDFALADKSGFGYINNTTWNGSATYQGFQALLATARLMKSGQAGIFYDFDLPVSASVVAGTTTATPPSEAVTAVLSEQQQTDLAAALSAATVNISDSSVQTGALSGAGDRAAVISLSIRATGITLDGSDNITRLTLDIQPQYNRGAGTLDLPNSAISRLSVTLPVPAGMSVDEHTRINHGSDWLTPTLSTVGAQKYLTIVVSSFSEFTLYADARLDSVRLDPQGGRLSGSSVAREVSYYLADEGDALPTPTRSGYLFKGWYEDEDGDGSRYRSVSASLPATLYAIWEKEELISVSLRLIGDWDHDDGVSGHDEYITWIKTTDYSLPADSTVGYLLELALDEADLSSRGASGGYVSAIKAPSEFGGYWLSELDNGPDSGWMFTVNGKHPDQGMSSYVLDDGDRVIWHYADDYDVEENRATWLEAEDISPARYIQKYGDTSLILKVGEGGTVTPSGNKLADYLGEKVTFTITPDAGYQIKDVVVDGKSQGAISSYTYKKLSVDSRIKVSFELIRQAVTFPDMTDAHWAYAYVNDLAARGVVGGYANGCFYPDASVNRADFVVMLARLSGQSLPVYNGRFNDVSAGDYYAQAVAWAAAVGVVNGDAAGNFLPTALISRQDMAAMLYRYANYMGISLPGGNTVSFSDSSKIAGYAGTAVKAMYQANIVGGYPDGSFRPVANASRAEAAKMIYLLDRYR